MHIEVHWQDGDSSSANSLRVYYPDKTKTLVMLCGGHVARAHVNKLKKMAGVKIFTKRYKNKHRVKFPELSVVVQVVNTRRSVVVYQISSLDKHVLISFVALLIQIRILI